MPTSTFLCAKAEALQRHFICQTLTFPDFFSKSVWLSEGNGQSIYSNRLFSLFMGALEIHQHRASFQEDLDTDSITPAPWSHVTERFSWSIHKDLLGSLWSEHFWSGEAEEIGKLLRVRKISSCTSIVVALNFLHIFFCFLLLSALNINSSTFFGKSLNLWQTITLPFSPYL